MENKIGMALQEGGFVRVYNENGSYEVCRGKKKTSINIQKENCYSYSKKYPN